MKKEETTANLSILHSAFMHSNMNSPIIELKNLTRRYGHLEAVNGLNITVQPGRCYGFFGRNGAGKTTTIKCLLNLLQPTSGTARLFGLDPQRQEVAVKSRLSYVPDTVAFYPWMTVDETLRFIAVVPPALEPRDGGRPAQSVPTRPPPEDQPSLQGAENATGPRWRGLSRAGVARVGRTDLRPGPHRAPRIHPDRHRRLSRRRSRTPHGVCLDPPHRRIRRPDRPIHHHRARTRTAHHAGGRGAGPISENPRQLSQPPAGLDLSGALQVRQSGRDMEILADGNRDLLLEKLRACHPDELRCDSLSLEEIFVAAGTLAAVKP